MSLRSTLTKLLGSFCSSRSSRSLAAGLAGAAVAAGIVAASAPGCGGDNRVVCDSVGKNCQICDAYGCRPANPDGSTGTGGQGVGGGVSTGGSPGTGGAGGAPACDPKQATCGCTASSDCSDGKQCIDGLCIDGCNFSYECGAGKVCFNGSCETGCDATTPCDAGYACDKGVCTLDPTSPECSDAAPCANGEICVKGICTTGCTADSQCGAGEVCDGTSHACIPDPSPKPICDTAKPCPVPEVCQADGYCHYPCADVNHCKLIDNRFVACDQGVCKTDAEVNPECTLANPCPAGKDCVSNKCL